MTLLRKIIKATKEGGLSTLLYRGYRYVMMKLLPEGKLNYNGVDVKGGHRFGFLIPEGRRDDPKHEKGMSKALRDNVSTGDDVVVVGGGKGVTSIISKRKAGSEGSVVAYEPVSELCEDIRDNSRLNDVNIEVINAFVGRINKAEGNVSDADRIDPKELPECDILELDCEGAETDILKDMDIRPRVLVVESHGVYGSPTSKVKNILKKKGYKIESVELAEESNKVAPEKDVRAITAIRSE